MQLVFIIFLNFTVVLWRNRTSEGFPSIVSVFFLTSSRFGLSNSIGVKGRPSCSQFRVDQLKEKPNQPESAEAFSAPHYLLGNIWDRFPEICHTNLHGRPSAVPGKPSPPTRCSFRRRRTENLPIKTRKFELLFLLQSLCVLPRTTSDTGPRVIWASPSLVPENRWGHLKSEKLSLKIKEKDYLLSLAPVSFAQSPAMPFILVLRSSIESALVKMKKLRGIEN